MQVRERQRSGEATAHTMDADQTQVAPSGPWARPLGITAAVACATLLIVVAIISSTGGSRLRRLGPTIGGCSSEPCERRRDLRDGSSRKLGPGSRGWPTDLILPSDVTSRLAVQ